MDGLKNIYETIFVLNPELTEEEAEAGLQNVVRFLEDRGGEIIRVDRAGKRRLAYPVAKQRYGYYSLLHYRVAPETPAALERSFRLNERVIRYLTVRYTKEEQLTGFTRLTDDDGHEEEREERRRGGRRGDAGPPRMRSRGRPAMAESVTMDDDHDADDDDFDEGRGQGIEEAC
jgi:small subunit ribosomal protein S6